MKKSKTIKKYLEKMLSILNKDRFLGTKFLGSRIVENILVTILDNFEASIATLETSNELCFITLTEILHELKTHE